MSELSSTSGFPVATIKYYLRETLLAPGTSTARNQADYGEGHVQRLRLIRVLQSVGGMSVAKVRQLLAAIDDQQRPLLEVLGTMQESLAQPASPPVDESGLSAAERQLAALFEKRGWGGWVGDPNRSEAARLLATWSELSPTVSASALADVFDAYAEAAEIVGERDVELIARQTDRDSVVDVAVVGTVLGDALFAVLRRLAQVHISQKHFPRPDPESDPNPKGTS